MKILVSVILPVYNGEKYISDAVLSVFAQSFQGWELIIVDDCSTDATPGICSAFQQTKNVTVIRPDRRLGVSGARNIGIQAARGKYIAFLDADDTLTEHSLGARAAVMEEHHLAMGVFNYVTIIDGGEPQKTNLSKLGKFDATGYFGRAAFFQVGSNLGFEGTWDKMFRSDIIRDQNICFREGVSMYEDNIFSLEYAAACDGWIEVADLIVLNYNKRSGNKASLTAQFWNGKFRRAHEVIREYFVMLSEQLRRRGIFEAAVREGVYHGYINKMIGAMYACAKSGEGGYIHSMMEAEALFEDACFMKGVELYQCKSPGEDPGIIEALREKNADSLRAYLAKRIGRQSQS